jgi:hypothetical protein
LWHHLIVCRASLQASFAAIAVSAVLAAPASAQAPPPLRPAPEVTPVMPQEAQPDDPQRQRPQPDDPRERQAPPVVQPPVDSPPRDALPAPINPPPLYGQPGPAPPAPVGPPTPYGQPEFTTAASPPTPHRRLVLLMASVGVSGFEGGSGINDFFGSDVQISTCPRLDTMVGAYVHPRLSLNAELTVDIVKIEGANGAGLTSGTRGIAAFSPLFHLPIGDRVELVAGPKLGLWRSSLHLGGRDADWIVTGTVLGINAGAYYHLGRALLGVITTYESATIDGICMRSAGSPDDCNHDFSYLASKTEKVASVAGSVLF